MRCLKWDYENNKQKYNDNNKTKISIQKLLRLEVIVSSTGEIKAKIEKKKEKKAKGFWRF